MQRREFITLVGGAAATWPIAGYAQQGERMPVVGFLRSTSLAPFEGLVTAFRQGLTQAGFVEGQNVTVEYRYADNQSDRLPVLVAELIGLRAAALVVNIGSAHAAKTATTTVPIVFAGGRDPVQAGLVASLNKPGGNVTGVVWLSDTIVAKRLDLLRQLVPKATIIAVLAHTPETDDEQRDLKAAAQASGQQLIVLDVGSDRDIETAFATFVQGGAGALLVGGGAFLASYRERLIALAARHLLPVSCLQREYVTAGGLMSYSASQGDAYRQAGIYTGRILKGEKPADLPVVRSTKIDFVLNLRTAKTLGLTIPPGVLAIADEVIE